MKKFALEDRRSWPDYVRRLYHRTKAIAGEKAALKQVRAEYCFAKREGDKWTSMQ